MGGRVKAVPAGTSRAVTDELAAQCTIPESDPTDITYCNYIIDCNGLFPV